jgi:two-component sensor histidine kinase
MDAEETFLRMDAGETFLRMDAGVPLRIIIN